MYYGDAVGRSACKRRQLAIAKRWSRRVSRFPARRAACLSNLQVWGFISPILLAGIQRRHTARLAGVTGHSSPVHIPPESSLSRDGFPGTRHTGRRRACCCVWTNWTAGSVQLPAGLRNPMPHGRMNPAFIATRLGHSVQMLLSAHAR